MYAQVEKTKENKFRTIANSIAQKNSRGQKNGGSMNNRVKSGLHIKMQEMINDKHFINSQIEKGSEIIQLLHGKQTATPIPDKLEYGESTMATTSAMVLMSRDGTTLGELTYTSGGGLHAEERVIQDLQELVNNGTLMPQGTNEDYIVVLNISKSPCSSSSMPATRTDGNLGCLERLTALNTNGLVGPNGTVTFSVQLAATKPYSPKVKGGKDSSRNNYQGFGGDGAGGGTFGFVR